MIADLLRYLKDAYLDTRYNDVDRINKKIEGEPEKTDEEETNTNGGATKPKHSSLL